jgi:NitT/TauT family transport system substrate-binding protein
VIQAFVAALDESMRFIAEKPTEAAALWTKAENSRVPAAEVERLIRLPENEWTTTPKKVMAYAEFMSRTGLMGTKPAAWQELFFEGIHAQPGS